MSEPESTLQRFVDRAGTLYTLPAVAMQVLQLTNHPQVDATALKQCIENDPALTTKILGVVNSSLFGLSREVSDLQQALALLGTKPLKLLVLGFSLPEKLFVGVAGEILGYYWRRTLTKAIAARELCELQGKQGGDEAFIAGLLGDVGVLALLKDLGAPYARFLDRVREENGDLLALERETLGFDHAVLSAGLLLKWGLPHSLTDAIAAPKSTEALRRSTGPGAQLPQILHLAELLAQLVSDRRIGALPELLEAARCYRGITRIQITTLVESLGEKVAQLADVLSLDLPDQKEFSDIVAEAHARLAEVAADTAAYMTRYDMIDIAAIEKLLAEAKELSAAVRAVAWAPLPIKSSEPVAAKSSATVVSATPHARHSVSRPASSFSSGPAAPVASAEITDSGTDAALFAPLAGLLNTCRQSRSELTLLLVEIDRLEEMTKVYGSDAQRKVTIILEKLAHLLEHPGKLSQRVGDVKQALGLPSCDRRQAVEVANEIVRTFCQFAEQQFAGGPLPVTISVGAATVTVPRKNLPPQEMIEAAQRCLYGAHVGGGNTVKSIEIY